MGSWWLGQAGEVGGLAGRDSDITEAPGPRVEVNYPTSERAIHRIQTPKCRAWVRGSEGTQSPDRWATLCPSPPPLLTSLSSTEWPSPLGPFKTAGTCPGSHCWLHFRSLESPVEKPTPVARSRRNSVLPGPLLTSRQVPLALGPPFSAEWVECDCLALVHTVSGVPWSQALEPRALGSGWGGGGWPSRGPHLSQAA